MIMGQLLSKLPRGIHAQALLYYLRREYNLPPIWYIDTFPFGSNMCVIMDADAAQQITVQKSLPKHEFIANIIWPIAGRNSLVSIEGSEHKRWRNIFNPGFSSAHLMTLVDGIVDDAVVFLDILDKHAKSRKMFYLENATTNVTVDIIGRVVL